MLIIITLGFAKDGRAQDSASEARELAKKAISISSAAGGDSQKLAQAIALFEEAFALDPRPQYQCSIGISYQESGKLSLAHLYLGRCIARTSDATRKAQLSKYHAAIEGELRKQGFVSVDLSSRPSGASLSIAALQEGKGVRTPILLWLGEGPHLIEASHAGHESVQIEIVVKGNDIVQTLELSPIVKPKEDPVPLKIEPDTSTSLSDSTKLNDSSSVLVVSSSAPDKRGPSKLWAYGAFGASVLAIGGAVWTYDLALDANEEIKDDDPRGDKYQELKSAVEFKEKFAYGLGAVAIVSAAVGAYLLLNSNEGSRSEDGRLDVALSEDGRGAFVSWSFRK